MSAIAVNESNFEQEVLNSNVPVLVDFWAVWCGPCKMLSPIIEELAANADGYKVCSVNVDEAQDLAMRYGVSAIPTLIVFKNGAEANRGIGFMPKERVLELLR